MITKAPPLIPLLPKELKLYTYSQCSAMKPAHSRQSPDTPPYRLYGKIITTLEVAKEFDDYKP